MAAGYPAVRRSTNTQVHNEPNGSIAPSAVLGPPESVAPAAIYKLYRGVTAEIEGERKRIWVDFPCLQLCWAGPDLPARSANRTSLLDLSACRCGTVMEDSQPYRVEICGQVDRTSSWDSSSRWDRASGSVSSPTYGGAVYIVVELRPLVASMMFAPPNALREFAMALHQLIESREKEGRRVFDFIQKRLFQYLWTHQGNSMSPQELNEAQAVLDFNLEPKRGVEYLRERLGRRTDAEVGQWLAQMSTVTGGLDPTMLGSYFSRKDTLEVFKTFVRCLNFAGMDIVQALRQLFDTFKPGGEGQVIARILELFAEAYFAQWKKCKDSTFPPTAYASSDSILQVAFSLIMLNTELHVSSRRSTATKLMTVEEYISNTRRVVGDEEVPEATLRSWYDAVKQDQVSVEPLPRVAFSKLPVQPDIEGWLVAILDAQTQRRFWSVLALQRMYLFSDASEVEPADTIDLKDTVVCSVREDQHCKDRFASDIRTRSCKSCFLPWGGLADLPDAEWRAFEVLQRTEGDPSILKNICADKPRTRFALVAESPDLADKWVQLISTGPY